MKILVPLLIIVILLFRSYQHKASLFFDYDTVDHYQSGISNQDFLAIATKVKQSKPENDFIKLINRSEPKSINDTNFLANLSEFYPKKTIITDRLQIRRLNYVFKEKPIINAALPACDPLYRDLLIFKKNNKIVGISKLCFSCGQNYTIGTPKGTWYLARAKEGDWERLISVLKIKKNFDNG
jgi:hypothetical protein